MKRMPRMGRPPLPEGAAKGVVFTLRLSETEREAVEAAAQRAGMPARKWARLALLDASRDGVDSQQQT
jgi:hypothetical protein